jgi:hypothetical protein
VGQHQLLHAQHAAQVGQDTLRRLLIFR